jgi:hypothetical protein
MARITKWDDYFLHQTPAPIIEPADIGASWMERFYWNVHSPDGAWAIGLGFGEYRNTHRMDAIAYVLLPKEQRIIKLARHTSDADYLEPTVGPMRCVIEEPLHQWRWQMAPTAANVSWDLQFHSERNPVTFATFAFGDDRTSDSSKYQHFVQLGTCVGRITVDGHDHQVEHALALRDRSWGVRRAREGQGLHLWLHHQFSGADIFIIYNESRDGSVAYFDGAVVDAQGEHRLVALGHNLQFMPALKDIIAAEITVVDNRGTEFHISYDPLLRGYVGGVGYGGWAGADHGDSLLEVERIDLTRPVAEILEQQPILLMDHLCAIQLNGRARTVGSFQMGITRSSAYTYRPRPTET